MAACFSTDHIARFWKGELDEPEAAEVRVHLASCRACRETLEEDDSRGSGTLLTPADSGRPVMSSLDPADPEAVFEPGQVVYDHYEVVEYLGGGGMAQVFKVHDRRLRNAPRALKVIRPSKLSEVNVKRFEREAKAMARLNHPHVVTLIFYDLSVPGRAYIVMEHVEGESLEKVLVRGRPMPTRWTADVLTQLCDVLGAAHGQDPPIIHRDLKPSNLMLLGGREAGREFLKVLDFGLAREFVHAGAAVLSTDYTGTPAYSSPEQFEQRPQDARSDLYTVGVILYEMLTGFRPFEGSFPKLFDDHRHTRAPAFSTRNPAADVSPDVEAVVLRCLEKDPALRPQTARELRDDFLAAVARSARPEDVEPGPAGEPDSPSPPGPRRPTWRVAAVVAALALAVSALLEAFLRERPTDPTDRPALRAILQDVRSRPSADRPFLRYFSLNHLRAGGASADVLELHRQALGEAVNLVSTGAAPVEPVAVDAAGTVLRVDLRALGWDSRPFDVVRGGSVVKPSPVNRFDLVLLEYPYAVVPNSSPEFDALEQEFLKPAAQVRPVAYVRADWFISSATRPPLFEDLNGLHGDGAEKPAPTPADVDGVLGRAVRSYVDDPVGFRTAACEVGVKDTAAFRARLNAVLGSAATPKGGVRRDDWERLFASAVGTAGTGVAVPPLEGVSRGDVRPPGATAPLEITTNKEANVFRPGDAMSFWVKNTTDADLTVELVGTGVSGRMAVVTKAPVLVPAHTIFQYPPQGERPGGVYGKVGKERLTAFAGRVAFPPGDLLRGFGTSDRFVHGPWQDGIKGIKMLDASEMFKTSIDLETRPAAPH